MGFGEAFINILLQTQGLLNYPLVYDKSSDRLLANPEFHNWRKMFRWHFGNCFIFSVFLFSIVHLIQLLKRYDPTESAEVGKAYKEEIMIYIFTVAITFQAVLTWETMGRNPDWLAYAEGQILRAYNCRYQGWPNAQRVPDIYEWGCYSLYGGFLAFPLVAIVLCIIRDHDPINRMFRTFIPFEVNPYVRQGTVILAYYTSVHFGAMSCLNGVLMTAAHCFITTRLSQQNLAEGIKFLKFCPTLRHFPKMYQIMQNIDNLRYSECKGLKIVFQRRRRVYMLLKLITTSVNFNLSCYVPSMVGVGMALCIISNYGIIEFHADLPLFITGSLLVVTVFMSILMSEMVRFASYPNEYSAKFVAFWKGVRMSRMERKQLKALVPVYFGMGQYFPIKHSTALDIMNNVLGHTVNAVLSYRE